MHIIAFSVTTNETSENYEFLFTSIRSKIKKILNLNYRPEVLVSDSADAIANGFYKAFFDVDNAKNVTCWFHVVKALRTKLAGSQHISSVLADVGHIHLSSSEETFRRATDLFVEKRSEELPVFCKYFKQH